MNIVNLVGALVIGGALGLIFGAFWDGGLTVVGESGLAGVDPFTLRQVGSVLSLGVAVVTSYRLYGGRST